MWRAGTIRVARISGIAIDVHLTFGLVILWGAWEGWSQYGDASGAAYGILVILLLFGCVLIHELAHSLLARRLGLVVRRITLFPFGGLAQLETPPSHPQHELVIALAGPLANLVVALVLGGIAYLATPLFLRSWGDLPEMFFTPGFPGLMIYLVGANATLFLFNVLPAFPMDGGRVVRAGLALMLDYTTATRIAAWLGRIMALAMGIIGIIGWPPLRMPPSPLLVFGALVVYLGARQEELYVRQQRALVCVEVGDIYQHPAETIAPWDVLSVALVARLFRHDHALPVVVENRLVGLLTYQDTRRLVDQVDRVTVAHAMRTNFPVLRLHDTLWVALQTMNAYQLAMLPVAQGSVFQGVVSLDDINHAWRFAAQQRGASTLISGDIP